MKVRDKVEAEKEGNKSNVVIFHVDDLEYADLGCHGAIGVETTQNRFWR